jgi:hypothetical protein
MFNQCISLLEMALLVGLPPCRTTSPRRLSPRLDTPHRAKKMALLVVSLLVDTLLARYCPPRRPLLVGPFQDREILLVFVMVLTQKGSRLIWLPLL